MSIVTAVFDGNDALSWMPWDGTTIRFKDDAFAWIDVIDARGEEIEALRQVFGLHDLALEDSMGNAQVAKVDLYADHVFILAKVAELGPEAIQYTDVGIFLISGRAITICRTETFFGHSLRQSVHSIARRDVDGPEYVVHGVLDLIVDRYFPVVQMITDEVLLIEKRLLDASLGRDEIARIFHLRREAIHFQHTITRMIEVCNKLATLSIPCVSSDARPYFRDVLDKLLRIEAMTTGLIDVIRTSLEASSLLEQQRQSAITRQLAAWAGILGVPTAIAGIYGMNFINMPETHTRWGYFAALGLMWSICALLYWRFRRLGWLQPLQRRNTRPLGNIP
ncbi:magnesium and cobalt transport protein CorA [Luteibacter yeojuensis]|uniref:Magnesium and cobalt transport protein CorA n=1 Tax=Luteibacter yeojuensis TaxID=345309 RepID=A0A7X5TPD1_9GAMM|nr:magnesium and cobalt transport protein CorA [Luteibacter yeojuensis]NID14673.1 magnesium and cobalt transport protein CorA [Luteibacter yeojuensis]